MGYNTTYQTDRQLPPNEREGVRQFETAMPSDLYRTLCGMVKQFFNNDPDSYERLCREVSFKYGRYRWHRNVAVIERSSVPQGITWRINPGDRVGSGREWTELKPIRAR